MSKYNGNGLTTAVNRLRDQYGAPRPRPRCGCAYTSATKDKDWALKEALRHGLDEAVSGLLAAAGYDPDERPWRATLLNRFDRPKRNIPTLSTFTADTVGVKFRYMSARIGWQVRLLVDRGFGESVAEVQKKLEAAAARLYGPTVPHPDDPPTDASEHPPPARTLDDDAVQEAVDMVLVLEHDPAALASPDPAAYAVLVAREVGPTEDPAFWQQALDRAVDMGLLSRTARGYHPAPADAPPPPTPPPPPAPAPTPAPIVVPTAAPDSGTAPAGDWVELVATRGGDLMAVLATVRDAVLERQTVDERLAEQRAKVAALEAERAAVTRRIEEAGRRLDPGALVLLGTLLGGGRG